MQSVKKWRMKLNVKISFSWPYVRQVVTYFYFSFHPMKSFIIPKISSRFNDNLSFDFKWVCIYFSSINLMNVGSYCSFVISTFRFPPITVIVFFCRGNSSNTFGIEYNEKMSMCCVCECVRCTLPVVPSCSFKNILCMSYSWPALSTGAMMKMIWFWYISGWSPLRRKVEKQIKTM